MAIAMLEILHGFSSEWILLHRQPATSDFEFGIEVNEY